MKKLCIVVALIMTAAFAACGCGGGIALEKESSTWEFSTVAEDQNVTTFFDDSITSETGGFTVYNESGVPVDVYINSENGGESYLIEDIDYNVVWHSVEKGSSYTVGVRTDAEPGTEITISIIDGDEANTMQ